MFASATFPRLTPTSRAATRQRGVVLLYALIAMVILMVSGMALLRGMGSALAVSGNFALRRDLLNQGEVGVSTALQAFAAGAPLGTASNRNGPMPALNYSEQALPDLNGIPTALLDDTVFATVGSQANDITPTTGVSVRYVIDRLCKATGTPTLSNCAAYKSGGDKGNMNNTQNAGTTFQPVYRITVRVTGPKNTITFLQTTMGT
jgi:Tfp pilus assembly protein PilX